MGLEAPLVWQSPLPRWYWCTVRLGNSQHPAAQQLWADAPRAGSIPERTPEVWLGTQRRQPPVGSLRMNASRGTFLSTGEGGRNTTDAPGGNPLESLPHQTIEGWVRLRGYKRNSPGSATRKVENEMLGVSAGRWEARLDHRIRGGVGEAHPRPSPQPPAIPAWFNLHGSLSIRSAGLQEATKW